MFVKILILLTLALSANALESIGMPIRIQGPVTMAQPYVSATIITTASILLVSQKVLDVNAARKGLIIYNNSTNSVYIAFDSTVNSGTHMTAIIPTFAQWIAPTPCYTGAVAAIRNAGNGALFITELQ